MLESTTCSAIGRRQFENVVKGYPLAERDPIAVEGEYHGT
jgi:hypothetical protein